MHANAEFQMKVKLPLPSMCFHKHAGLDGLPSKLFIAVSVELLVSLIRISWDSEVFPREQ